jgi:hypothetical protein
MPKVFFYFPDKEVTHLSLDMDTIPRQGEGIRFQGITRDNFEEGKGYETFRFEEYSSRVWTAELITWHIEGLSYKVFIDLKETIRAL